MSQPMDYPFGYEEADLIGHLPGAEIADAFYWRMLNARFGMKSRSARTVTSGSGKIQNDGRTN